MLFPATVYSGDIFLQHQDNVIYYSYLWNFSAISLNASKILQKYVSCKLNLRILQLRKYLF